MALARILYGEVIKLLCDHIQLSIKEATTAVKKGNPTLHKSVIYLLSKGKTSEIMKLGSSAKDYAAKASAEFKQNPIITAAVQQAG